MIVMTSRECSVYLFIQYLVVCLLTMVASVSVASWLRLGRTGSLTHRRRPRRARHAQYGHGSNVFNVFPPEPNFMLCAARP